MSIADQATAATALAALIHAGQQSGMIWRIDGGIEGNLVDPIHDGARRRAAMEEWVRIIGATGVTVTGHGRFDQLEAAGSYYGVPVAVATLVERQEQDGDAA